MNQHESAVCTTLEMYTHAVDETRIALVGMAHFGEPSFYDRVQTFLDNRTMDGVNVQYEGIMELGPTEAITRDMAEKARLFTGSDEVLADFFADAGLVRQEDAITLRDSWLNKDMTIPELLNSVSMSDMATYAQNMERAAQAIKATPRSGRRALAFNLLQEAINLANTGAGLGTPMDGVLVEERNRIALRGIDEQRKRRPDTNFALTWGQGHLSGLGKGLRQRGYALRGKVRMPVMHE